MKNIHIRLFIAFYFLSSFGLRAQQTEIQYLSGTDNEHTINWEFFCTSGRNSGKWTTIPVPSNWELQGFGKYNYGLDKDSLRGKEKGLYKYHFTIPSTWKGKIINIVFDGSMTDTEVKINGKPAGPIHQGAFYRFGYDITSLLKPGKDNLLEVTVAKHSANESVNGAERKCDFWIFGGIFRPVYLEALPKQYIRHIAIDAGANGNFQADVLLGNIAKADEISAQIYTISGQKVGNAFQTKIIPNNQAVRLQTSVTAPALWSPEFPNLYHVVFTLIQDGKPVHTVKERFGFRTVELRERDGIYVNGIKIKFKGICRHSFWPSSGRTTSKKISILDVELMKDMNMNAVRMSHYPPDEHFLDVCDSLGLFVLDELAGWHHAYDAPTGTKLVAEMISRDINHPSIVVWANGNEGGHNFDLDPVFDRSDIQKRPVVHPWQIFRGTDTQHYINYDYGAGTFFHGHNVIFPTEFLHGLYDGGHGAGLDDYWELMWHYPLSAGGFLWDFSDEGVVRTDRNGELDTDGNHGADGILGPYREKEGSFFTAKEVWAPVFFEKREITPAFDGSFTIENRYAFTNTNQCKFSWRMARLPGPFTTDTIAGKTGTATSPDILPGSKGILKLQLPLNWQQFDVLYITAQDPQNRPIFTWSWPISLPAKIAQHVVPTSGIGSVDVAESDTLYTFKANGISITLNRKTGLLQQVKNEKGIIPFTNGPVLCDGIAEPEKLAYRKDGNNLIIEGTYSKKSHYAGVVWTIYPSGWIKLDVRYSPIDEVSAFLGISFSFPENEVKSVRWMGDGPYRVWKNRIKGNSLNVWEKAYNNSITGIPGCIYPEFKGYHSRMYWARILTTNQPFTIVTSNEDIFLRLFTPATPKETFNTAPAFPSGDISFMQGITAIGTKSQKPENMGPMGKKNMYFDYWKARPKEMTLYFDFSGK